ncbi:dentin sialophosphoprotein-like [Cimex lectularius]|uniref:Uncharacterized protein n=1 Tax=Cimex lectularius TaxID=79782 RepID=A0A8I6RXR0_CIMLE|nr:dentin sialophosphoprotein-like [Cimex lectularius]
MGTTMSDITVGGSTSHKSTEEFDDNCSVGSVEDGKYSPISFYPCPENDSRKMRSSSPIASASSSRNSSSTENGLSSNSFSESFSHAKSQPRWVEPDNSKGIQVNARDLPSKRKTSKKTGANEKKKQNSLTHPNSSHRITRSKSKQMQSTETIQITCPIREEAEETESAPIYHQQTIYEQSAENVLLLEERQENPDSANSISKESEIPTNEANFEDRLTETSNQSIELTQQKSLTLNIVGLQGMNNQTVQPFNIVIPSDNEIKTVNISFNQEKIGSPKVKLQTEEKHTSPMQSTSSGYNCYTPKSKGKMENLATCPISKQSKRKSTKSTSKKKVNSSKKGKHSRMPNYSDSSSCDSSDEYDSSDCCSCSFCSDGYDSSNYSSSSSSNCYCWENYRCAPKKQTKKLTKKKSTKK